NKFTIARTYLLTDTAGQSTSCTQPININDSTPPRISCPQDMTVLALSPGGATVTYPTPAATDNCGGNPAVTCTPASGSSFPIGSTPVSSTARDDCAHAAS